MCVYICVCATVCVHLAKCEPKSCADEYNYVAIGFLFSKGEPILLKICISVVI